VLNRPARHPTSILKTPHTVVSSPMCSPKATASVHPLLDAEPPGEPHLFTALPWPVLHAHRPPPVGRVCPKACHNAPWKRIPLRKDCGGLALSDLFLLCLAGIPIIAERLVEYVFLSASMGSQLEKLVLAICKKKLPGGFVLSMWATEACADPPTLARAYPSDYEILLASLHPFRRARL